MSMNTIEVHQLEKSYRSVRALKEISFSVQEGELFGLIGPDGAGKTTLFRILTTLLLPDAGQAIVHGSDVVKEYRKIRSQVGYMPGRFSLYQDMTVEENLRFFASVFGTTVKENYDLIKDIYVQIEPFKDRRAGALSGGMKQKLALSCALIHKPTVLFLDEPTTGVDLVSRREFWGMLRNLKQQGITILVSTPYMDEAVLCDRIALMQEGQFLQITTPAQLTADYKETLWAVKAHEFTHLLKALRDTDGVKTCFSFGDAYHVTVDPSRITTGQLRTNLAEREFTEISVSPIQAGVEDCYMLLSQHAES